LKYGPSECSEHELADAENLSALMDDSDVTWVNLAGLGDADVIVRVGEIFGLHPLALEDVVNVHQRPKLESYGDYLFLIARDHRTSDSGESKQVAMFLGKRFVITFQESELDGLDIVRQRILAGRGKIRSAGADYLLYAILDSVIDGYFPVLELYGERLDVLDDLVAANAERSPVHQIHNIRSELLGVRRSVWPLREAISGLIRDSGDLISDETDLYLRDCYDHAVQIIDVIETDRELCADLRDFYLTVVSHRMNQVMRFLTVIATLFIPLSFIAGLYGMNFNTRVSRWNMPELNWALGYPFALSLMAIIAVTLLTFFWRKGWLS